MKKKSKAPENWETAKKVKKERTLGWPDFTPKSDLKKKRGKK